jgi:hypothetical protein
MILTRSAKIIIGLISVGAVAVVSAVSYIAYNFYQKAQQTLDEKSNQPPLTANQTPQVIYQSSGSSVSVSEVITGIVDLTGAAPSGAKYGINTANGKTFYVNSAGNWTVSTSSVANSTLSVSLASNLLKNGNVEKYIVPVALLTTDNYLPKIETDLSSQPRIIYQVLGVQKDNELTVQITNPTGSDVNTLPLTISILKFS